MSSLHLGSMNTFRSPKRCQSVLTRSHTAGLAVFFGIVILYRDFSGEPRLIRSLLYALTMSKSVSRRQPPDCQQHRRNVSIPGFS